MSIDQRPSVAPEVMKRLMKLRNELLDSLQSTLDKIASRAELPSRLFHFTDVEGMIGIIKSRSLRGTLATSLNDTSELRTGIQQAELVLKKRLERKPNEFDARIHAFLNQDNFNAAGRFDVQTCVVSFCPTTDLSLHWMHYGRNGTGCALGFSPSKLAVGHLRLFKLRYQFRTQQEVIDELLQTAHTIVKRSIAPLKSESDILRYLHLAAHMTVAFIRAASSVFKHEAFQYEDEWRMSFQLVLNAKSPRPPRGYKFQSGYRSTNGRVCPFGDIIYPQDKFPLESITLGRASAMSEDDEGLRVLLQDSLGPDAASRIVVTRSEVPIRP